MIFESMLEELAKKAHARGCNVEEYFPKTVEECWNDNSRPECEEHREAFRDRVRPILSDIDDIFSREVRSSGTVAIPDEPKLRCAFCFFEREGVASEAISVVNGNATCEDHLVNTPRR